MRSSLRYLLLFAAGITIAVFVSTLLFIGAPFSTRPFGSSPIQITDSIWLNYDVTFENVDDWSWQLILNTRQEHVRPWDELASGETIISGVKEYQAVRPWLVVVRYAIPNHSDKWKRVDLSHGIPNWDDKDFNSEAELTDDLRKLGVTDALKMKKVPTFSRLTDGGLSSIIISTAFGALLLAILHCRNRSHRANA